MQENMMLMSVVLLLIGCGEKEEDTAVEPVAEPTTEPSGEPSSEEVDEDGDGVIASDDCDDSDPDLGATELDADCDGVLTEFDCDDEDEMVTAPMKTIPIVMGLPPSMVWWQWFHFTVVADDADCDGVIVDDWTWRCHWQQWLPMPIVMGFWQTKTATIRMPLMPPW